MPKVSPLHENKPTKTAPAFAYLKGNVNVNDTNNGTNNNNSNDNVNNNKNNNDNGNNNVDKYDNVYTRKKKKFEELHTRTTHYVDNELLAEMNAVCGDEKGVKTAFINDAIREHLKKIKRKS